MVTISKSTIHENVHQTIYSLINSITGLTGKVYAEFPELSLQAQNSKSSYPVVIINSSDLDNWEGLTLKKLKISGRIAIELYNTSAKDSDWYASDIIDKIETSVNSLRNDGLKSIMLDSENKDVVQRGKINVHVKTLTFSFEFIFNRSSLSY